MFRNKGSKFSSSKIFSTLFSSISRFFNNPYSGWKKKLFFLLGMRDVTDPWEGHKIVKWKLPTAGQCEKKTSPKYGAIHRKTKLVPFDLVGPANFSWLFEEKEYANFLASVDESSLVHCIKHDGFILREIVKERLICDSRVLLLCSCVVYKSPESRFHQ